MDPAQLDPSVLAPIGFAAIGAMLTLLFEVFLTRGSRAGSPDGADASGEASQPRQTGLTLAVFSSVFLLFAIYTAASMFASGTNAVFNPARPMLRLDAYSSLATIVIAVAALLSLWLSITYLMVLRISHGEYYALLLLATTGMFVMVASVDLMAVFMGFELMSVPIYALAGFDRSKLRSNESGLKYFLIGAFASAILLYGIALLYGATGHTDFAGIREAFAFDDPIGTLGVALILVGFTFKVAAVPFHQWAPDVYEGAPTSVTAFMSVTVKAAAFIVLLRFLTMALPEMGERLGDVLWVVAALTMIVGNVMAVIQTNVKRMLAYSSIAHAGYLLIAFVAGTGEAHSAVLFYLVVYVFMNLGAFGVVLALTRAGAECERIDDFAGLARTRPGLAGTMSLFMLALAGIPGTAGFMAKFYLFSAAVQADLVVLTIIAVLTSVVSLYYYLRLPVAMYMQEPGEGRKAEASSSELLVLGICTVMVLYLGFFPNPEPFATAIRALDVAGSSVAYVP